eukprot:TRINITY_DN6676_c0_g1_i1.p1 TRINITY_DN6676_c0_g1~~TRINITY_DN6676_c0_g1_i1.p1  ORF type:complete len:551 (-),score=77.47 TRINITY_DN6676_c0_g1_i1:162-1814(-)
MRRRLADMLALFLFFGVCHVGSSLIVQNPRHKNISRVSDSCESIDNCWDIAETNCGWCWQTQQAELGTPIGPLQGSCGDWTWLHDECPNHVDCPALPNCLNIADTDCGWCLDNGKAYPGKSSGPSYGSCKSWIWNHDSCPESYGPEQIHIAFTNQSNQLMLMWSTRQQLDSAVIYSAFGSGAWQKAAGITWLFNDSNPSGLQFMHKVLLDGLTPGQKYEYFVQSGNLSSANFTFTAMPEGSDWTPYLLVYGDMGRHGGAPSLGRLNTEVDTKNVTAVIHVGDFAYDLSDDGGRNGDAFMNRIQHIAARVPYMTTPGNHEIESNSSFHHYRNRFAMPRSDENDGWDMWHSWDLQNVHFIAYSSEIFFARTQDIQRQYEWLKQDLDRANLPENRQKHPWIIAYGHRPFYCSNIDGDDCTTPKSVVRAGLESLFHYAGVDIIIEGHEHSYERLWPVFNETVFQTNYINPKGAVHLVTGAAGCNENDGNCINPMAGPKGPWSAFRSWTKGTYGYARMTVANATHLYWEEVLEETNAVEDAVWIIQEQHGPRAWP